MSRAGKRYFTASYESVLILTILHHMVTQGASCVGDFSRNLNRELTRLTCSVVGSQWSGVGGYYVLLI